MVCGGETRWNQATSGRDVACLQSRPEPVCSSPFAASPFVESAQTCDRFDPFGNPISIDAPKCGRLTPFEMRAFGSNALAHEDGTPFTPEEVEAGYREAWAKMASAGKLRERGELLFRDPSRQSEAVIPYGEAIADLEESMRQFLRLGFANDAAASKRLLLADAQKIGRTDIVAWYAALDAIDAGKVDEAAQQLESLPHDDPRRVKLSEVIARSRAIDRMGLTFLAASSLAGMKLDDAEARDLFGVVDHAAREQKLAYLLTVWRDRIQKGTETDTETLLRHLWKDDLTARAGIALLILPREKMGTPVEDLPAEMPDLSGNYFIPQVTLYDALLLEQHDDTGPFESRLVWLSNNAHDDAYGPELSALAQVYRDVPGYEAWVPKLDKFATPATDIMLDIAIPGMIAELGTAAVLSRSESIIARVASWLGLGRSGTTLVYKAGVGLTRSLVGAGIFTMYDQGKKKLNDPRINLSGEAFLKQWATLALCMGVSQIAQVPLTGARRMMSKVPAFADVKAPTVILPGGQQVPALSKLGAVTYGAADFAMHTGAFHMGNQLAYGMGLSDHAADIGHDIQGMLTFRIGNRLGNAVTNGEIRRMSHEIENRPFLDAAQHIGEALAGESGPRANFLRDVVFNAYTRGDFTEGTLFTTADMAEQGELSGATVHDVLGAMRRVGDAHSQQALTPAPVYATAVPEMLESRGDGLAPEYRETGDDIQLDSPTQTAPRTSVKSLEIAVIEHLARGARLLEVGGAVLETPLEFREARKTVSKPVPADAYSPLDRSLLVVEGSPGKRFSLQEMDPAQREQFELESKQRGYATTNIRRNGETRTDAHTVEYHLVGTEVDPETLEFLKRVNPYLKVVRYGSVEDVASGRGEVIYDAPRQYRMEELRAEGEVRVEADAVSVYRDGQLVRRYAPSQVTAECYHYEGRLDSQKARDVEEWTTEHGLSLSTMTAEQGADLLNHLANEKGWTLSDAQQLVGVEGMKQFFGYGNAVLFGFQDAHAFEGFKESLLHLFERSGIDVQGAPIRLYIAGSAVSGYTSKGGEFRWTARVNASGEQVMSSDADVWLTISRPLAERLLEMAKTKTRPNLAKQVRLEELRHKLAHATEPLIQQRIQKRIAEVELEPEEIAISGRDLRLLEKRVLNEGYFKFEDLPQTMQAEVDAIMRQYPQLRDTSGLVVVEGGNWDRSMTSGGRDAVGDSIYDTPYVQWDLTCESSPELLESR